MSDRFDRSPNRHALCTTFKNLRIDIVMQHVKLSLTTLVPPVEVLVRVPDTPFPLQLPVGAPGKTMDGVPGSQLWPGLDLHKG